MFADGSVILWDIRDLNQKEHKTLRVNIEFDHASHVVWSPDSKAFIVHTVRENCIAVYKIEKKKDGMIGSAAPVIAFDRVYGKKSTKCELYSPTKGSVPPNNLELYILLINKKKY
ncbi:Transducin beta-like protein 2 [Eumeta japonica]|uniref:Transducin beta-like protein 2 n=1 Tax=Eumeta variegata TaxID=151549 RepID=A0A4C1VEB3_EUMVA|nr:Transducin beta-like protein 2 [Eumeta japonica]